MRFCWIHQARLEQQHTNKTMSDTHDVTISGFDLDRLESELAEAKEQRDRLAEALERVNECLSNAEDVMHGAGSDDVSRSRRVISDTLAAVKGGTP
jgi:hypothetical protein